MNCNYVAKKSAWSALTPLTVLFFWLIIPLFVIIARVISVKAYSLEFYDDYIIEHSGVINKHEKRIAFAGVVAVNLEQTLIGRMCNYGTLAIDVIGAHDLCLKDIAKPKDLKEYLETKLTVVNATVVA